MPYCVTESTFCHEGTVKEIHYPRSEKELFEILAQSKPGTKFSIAGTKHSQGGQTWSQGNVILDTSNLSRILTWNPNQATVTVQCGTTWCKLQQFLYPKGFTAAVMQSYNDFSVGGSVAVNAHGRDIHYGPLIDTIQSLSIVLKQKNKWKLACCSRERRKDLFAAVVGGYGICGMILRIKLDIVKNCILSRQVTAISLEAYQSHFFNQVLGNKTATLHNAELHRNNQVLAITWQREGFQPSPTKEFPKLQEPAALYFVPSFSQAAYHVSRVIKRMRHGYFKWRYSQPKSSWRSHEMSSSIKELSLCLVPEKPVLQEYFVPFRNLQAFVSTLHATEAKFTTCHILNISIRFVKADFISVWSYAPQDCFSIVLFLRSHPRDKSALVSFTQKLLDQVILLQGRFYLPYGLFASCPQFASCYDVDKMKSIRSKYDPDCLWTNSLLEKYLSKTF